jgi:hypothetical protein
MILIVFLFTALQRQYGGESRQQWGETPALSHRLLPEKNK